MANVLDSDLEVIEFKPHLCYYVIFWTNTLKESVNLLIPPRYGLNGFTAILLQG